MLNPLHLLCRSLFPAVFATCLLASMDHAIRAQEPSVNDNADQPTALANGEESKTKPADKPADTTKPSVEKPVEASSSQSNQPDKKSGDNPSDKPAEKKDEKPADKQEDKPDDKKKSESEAKRPDMEGAEPKRDDQAKNTDGEKSKEASNHNVQAPVDRPKTPRRIHGLGSFDGIQLRNQPWKIHDIRRPHPPVVTPGDLSTYEKPGTAPSDAVVLFDGKDLSQWAHLDRELPNELIEAQWKVQDGYFEVTPGFGSLQTLEGFGSCHLHLEWQAPANVRGDGQNRGNSGIKFMSSFEVQILDSYNNRTYADGQAGAIYGQYPPMVNASRKPGEWQVYDILFIAPKFSLDGKLIRPASATVMHNGIFVQNAREYAGPSGAHGAMYSPLTPAAPIMLQDHGSPVRFRNIWVRNIPDVE